MIKMGVMKKVTVMVKKTVLYSVLVSFFLVSCSSEDKGQYDTRALASLDAMSEAIGELSACSYSLNDVNVLEDGTKYYNQHDVYMRGPDKMYVHSVGTKGDRSTWYDGSTLAYYSFDKNTYATVEAPDSIMKMIDHINEKYGIDFPAADFFYPDFTDDVLDDFDHVLFMGDETINGVESTSVLASNDNTIVQVWIDKATNLPVKFLIDSKASTAEYYVASFSNFRVNPDLPDLLFEINAPINSESIDLKPSEKK